MASRQAREAAAAAKEAAAALRAHRVICKQCADSAKRRGKYCDTGWNLAKAERHAAAEARAEKAADAAPVKGQEMLFDIDKMGT